MVVDSEEVMAGEGFGEDIGVTVDSVLVEVSDTKEAAMVLAARLRQMRRLVLAADEMLGLGVVTVVEAGMNAIREERRAATANR